MCYGIRWKGGILWTSIFFLKRRILATEQKKNTNRIKWTKRIWIECTSADIPFGKLKFEKTHESCQWKATQLTHGQIQWAKNIKFAKVRHMSTNLSIFYTHYLVTTWFESERSHLNAHTHKHQHCPGLAFRYAITKCSTIFEISLYHWTECTTRCHLFHIFIVKR